MQQESRSPCSTFFLEWLDRLSDEEHTELHSQLHCIMEELGCRVDRDSSAAKDLLNFPPHSATALSLN